jgi:hypothetical protein
MRGAIIDLLRCFDDDDLDGKFLTAMSAIVSHPDK